jgi:hypothetical protein
VQISERAVTAVPEDQAEAQSPRVVPPEPDQRPAPPVQSQEDTDLGWGEHPDSGNDERLYRDRPPHWGCD